MQETALDIEAPGAWDRDSGAGIIDALAAVGAVRNPFIDPTPGNGVRAVHLTELRTSIDAARRNCGLTNVAWTDPSIVSGVTPIKAAHITQPRAALNAAYQACSRTPPAWTDQIVPAVTPIKAVHFTELRNAVQTLGGPPPPPPPPPPGSMFGAGTWRVNSDIQPGRYFANPARGCYWERLSGLSGALSDIIANEALLFDSGQEIVDVAASDLAFAPDDDCGTWRQTPFPAPAVGTITPGRWLVGAQVPAGTYVATVPRGCYYEGVRSFGGTLNEIIANHFSSVPERITLTIGSSVVGFYTDDDCGTWMRVSGTSTRSDDSSGLDTDPATIRQNRQRHEASR